MAHIRVRNLQAIIARELKFWPVVCVLGPRQSGKSTLLRELLDMGTYRSLDPIGERTRASANPESWLSDVRSFPLIIDEAQKVPTLFDEIKSLVDAKRRPGRYILSGSVQFSKRSGIRESLTGRAAVLRMDPMTLGETESSRADLKMIQRYLEHGGMPGVCFLRSGETRASYWEQWLDTTCERDLLQLSIGRLNGTLARQILEQTAILEFPNVANIARALRVDARRITTHLTALRDLFAVREIAPLAVGKPIWLPFDCGMAHFLGADIRRRLQILFLNECLNAARFAGTAHPEMPKYYLTKRRSFVDFVDARGFHLLSENASPDRRDMMTLLALEKKTAKTRERIQVYCATEQAQARISTRIRAMPWRVMAGKA